MSPWGAIEPGRVLVTGFDPQGSTFVVDGKFGWAFSPYFSVELGSMFQRNQKPDRKGKTFEPADRLEFFLTLTGSSGLLR